MTLTRCSGWVSPTVFSWSKPHWGGFLKDQALVAPSRRILSHNGRRRSVVWHVGSSGYYHSGGCGGLFFSCRLFLNAKTMITGMICRLQQCLFHYEDECVKVPKKLTAQLLVETDHCSTASFIAAMSPSRNSICVNSEIWTKRSIRAWE